MFLKRRQMEKPAFFSRRKTRFRYWKDRLFILCVFFYLLNRYIVKPMTAGEISFFGCYFNDLICVPFWLPVVLFVTRKVGLRGHDEPPNIYELGFYLLLWSFMFEYVAPAYGRALNYPVADPWDVVCYVAGAIVAGLYWNYEITVMRKWFPSKTVG